MASKPKGRPIGRQGQNVQKGKQGFQRTTKGMVAPTTGVSAPLVAPSVASNASNVTDLHEQYAKQRAPQAARRETSVEVTSRSASIVSSLVSNGKIGDFSERPITQKVAVSLGWDKAIAAAKKPAEKHLAKVASEFAMFSFMMQEDTTDPETVRTRNAMRLEAPGFFNADISWEKVA